MSVSAISAAGDVGPPSVVEIPLRSEAGARFELGELEIARDIEFIELSFDKRVAGDIEFVLFLKAVDTH